jgi:hypothetical protein
LVIIFIKELNFEDEILYLYDNKHIAEVLTSIPNDFKKFILDNSAILKTIPWQPLKLEVGMKRYLREAFPDLTSDK